MKIKTISKKITVLLFSLILLTTLFSIIPVGIFPVSATVTRVQEIASAQNPSAGTNITVTLSSTPTEGNVLIATVGYYVGTAGVTDIEQTGVSWTLAVTRNVYGSVYANIWYGIVGSGASTTVTVIYAGDNRGCAGIVEYSGLDTENLLDVTGNTASGGSTTPSTGQTVTTSQDNQLWVGCTVIYGGSRTQSDPTNDFSLLVSQAGGTSVTMAYLKNCNIYRNCI
jgi:hypothetical protein